MEQLDNWRDVAHRRADGPLVYAFDGDVLVYGKGVMLELESDPPEYESLTLGKVHSLLEAADLAPQTREILERIRDDLSLLDCDTGEFAPNMHDPLIRRVAQN